MLAALSGSISILLVLLHASVARAFQDKTLFLDRDALTAESTSGRRRSHSATSASSKAACTSLVDHGTYYSVAVLVGTPAQKFDVVTDTGSDSLIIPSCLSGQEPCFTGTNSSSTFIAPKQDSQPLQIEFGSGTIVSAISTDTVEIAGVVTTLEDGLLLMVESVLDISEPLEGILGLGRPKPKNEAPALSQSTDQIRVPGFLEAAGVDRFSVCLNGGGNQPGVLRLDAPPLTEPMGSVGHMHWGLDFRGFSVGNASMPVSFCTAEDMTADQESPCGAIPDTGTTAIMGPAKQIRLLFSDICDAWPRCTEAAQKGSLSARPRHEVFQMLLLDCSSWLSDGGLDELPTLYLHLAGSGGKDNAKKTAALSGWAYVFQTKLDEISHSASNLVGVAPLDLITGSPTELWSSGPTRQAAAESTIDRGSKEVCAPAFGTTEYVTTENGPVWIMGLPLFYEYRISYDRSTDPPSMSLSNDESCGNCGDEASLAIHPLSGGPAGIVSGGRASRAPRVVRGKPRIPKWARSGELPI